MAEPYRMIAWAGAGQERLLRDAAGVPELRLVAVGSASSTAASELSRTLQVERFDDLRHAVHRTDIDLLWLADAAHVDREVLRLIGEVGLAAFTNQPQPASLGDLRANPERAAAVRFVPLMRRSPGCRAALDVMEDFGEVGALCASFRSGPGEGDLFARLYDAMDILDRFCGHADVLDAALAGPLETVPEALGELRGHMTVNVRLSERRSACAAVSDAGGAWFRGITVLGEHGCIRISDGGFEWLDPAGRRVDSTLQERSYGPGELAAMHMVRVMENLDCGEAPQTAEDNARVLAICEAARLSCRTGHGEAPRKVLEMLSRP